MGKNFRAIKLKLSDLIYPYFVITGKDKKETIKSFPGIFRFSLDRLLADIKETKKLGIRSVLLFGVAPFKDAEGSAAYGEGSLVARAVREIKNKFPDLELITDVCLCAYTNHGHCGILKTNQKQIDPQATLDVLSRIALTHARSGADWVAPSAMAKKQVYHIRQTLDNSGFDKVKIMGYSAKFASNFYGPFRNAAVSSPKFGDRRAYQLDYQNLEDALSEIETDIKEGADMVMVKPSLSYLDVISKAKEKFSFPLAAYNVSGEYAMVKYGATHGLWKEKDIVEEIISSLKRAGSNKIITYHAKDIAKWMIQKR